MNHDLKKFYLSATVNDQKELNIYLYGDVQDDYYDWWTGEKIESETGANFFAKTLDDNADVKVINLFINSNGGDVMQGTAIANLLRRHKATVNVTIDGFACSVASVIACAGDTVKMFANSVFMIHNAWTGFYGNADEFRKMADTLDKLMESARTIYLDKANGKLTEEQLIQMLDDETYFTAAECLEFGLCDEIIGGQAKTTVEPVMKDEKFILQKIEDRKKAMKLLKTCFSVEEKTEDSVNKTTDESKDERVSFFAKLLKNKGE